MKCTIPEISWHNRDPVLSVDVQAGKEEDFYRLASGGTDSHVVVWHLRVKDNGMAEVNFVADLQRHQRAVNTVRFSPSGEFLASGDDESAIIVWKQKTEQDAPELPSNVVETNTEQWLHVKILRGHVEDVYDLCWSPDSTCLVSGSVDNAAILWDIQKGRHTAILSDHKGFVQGVAWDPKNQYVATLSSDRTCRVFNLQTKKVVCRASKAPLPVVEGSDSELDGKPLRLFYDDTLKSFFRRLAFSPDGELLFAPSGIVESPDTNKHGNATHVFMRRMLNRPVMYLPSPDHYTIAVRCCPMLFKLHDGDSMFALPYRMIAAVATQSSVVLYDTQQPEPFAIISNIHYTRLTDLAWSSDGRVLVVASTDGFCSIVTFSKGELGEEYVPVKNSEIPTVPTTTADKKDIRELIPDKSSVGNGVDSACQVAASEETHVTEEKPKTCLLDTNVEKVVTPELVVGENITKKKPVRRIQPIPLTSRSNPRKSKAVITGHSDMPKVSPSKGISTYLKKIPVSEVGKVEILPRESSVVKHDSPDGNGNMDVEDDSKINLERTTSSRLVTEDDNELSLVSEVPDKESPTEAHSLQVGCKAIVPECEDTHKTRILCNETPSSETCLVTDSLSPEDLKPDSVADCGEISEQKEKECTASDKTECEGVEKMDIDEFVEAGAGTSNVLLEAEVTDDDCSKTLDEKSLCLEQSTVDDSKELNQIQVPEDNVASGSSGNPCDQDSNCKVDLGHSTTNDPKSEQDHRTPRKAAEVNCKPTSEVKTTSESPSGANAPTPTESPVPQAKKTPRRVQLITLSSPKSKRNLLQS